MSDVEGYVLLIPGAGTRRNDGVEPQSLVFAPYIPG
jgi:hypothetical protein